MRLPYEQLTAVIPNKKQVDWLTEMRDRREEEERDQRERERELHVSLPDKVEPSWTMVETICADEASHLLDLSSDTTIHTEEKSYTKSSKQKK